MSLSDQVAALESQCAALLEGNARLQARVKELEGIIGMPRDKFHSLRLTGMQKKILPLFLRYDVVTLDMLYQNMYRDGGSEPPNQKTVEVHLCKLRKKLPPGVKLCNEYAVGWYLTDESKAILGGRAA